MQSKKGGLLGTVIEHDSCLFVSAMQVIGTSPVPTQTQVTGVTGADGDGVSSRRIKKGIGCPSDFLLKMFGGSQIVVVIHLYFKCAC